jgi:hypothetical protein
VQLGVFVFLALAMVAAGYRSYLSHKTAQEARVHRGLEQVAKLKANEVAAWRLERLADAAVAAMDAQLMPTMQKLLKSDEGGNTRHEGQFLKTAKLLGADATLAKPIEARVLYEMVGVALS